MNTSIVEQIGAIRNIEDCGQAVEELALSRCQHVAGLRILTAQGPLRMRPNEKEVECVILLMHQRTMLIAATGATELMVLRPGAMTRVPKITPQREFQLYSMAGAQPAPALEPELSRMLVSGA